jgi:hypothetical protein
MRSCREVVVRKERQWVSVRVREKSKMIIIAGKEASIGM